MSNPVYKAGAKRLSEWHAKAARCPDEKLKDKSHLNTGLLSKLITGAFKSV
jgi:hypothetical protein